MLVKYVQQKAIEIDKKLSFQLYRLGNRISIQKHYLQLLEYSCHGIPWLAMVIIIICTLEKNDFWINLLIGLIFDIIYVALLKASCRRCRPTYAPQAQHNWIAVDKLSFPSGHASRSIYVALIFSDLWFSFLVWIWAIAVALSRVLYGRHFLGDILAGCLLGCFNYITQFTIFFPIHSLVKWFLFSMVYETTVDNF
ncbi:putative lipid phosphate phosphatase beta [Sarcoptes scabiei]|uniref:Presqualene diphosphate phosphatase-like protein n=1 Tax=Sarcoptes scabiei TaxID=52283 RepID=A0A132AAQ4_SARSC|nr:putative lipid phosphate phosphatase beta [Sarcoptes scabiei]KPM08066.1 presqualene diphosphate phosphatase-like protein [Sarcoptes scabiei]